MNVVTDQRAEFVEAVEAYLRRSGIGPYTFGKKVLNDPNFIYDLRAGREPRDQTKRRVVEWMNNHPVDGVAA